MLFKQEQTKCLIYGYIQKVHIPAVFEIRHVPMQPQICIWKCFSRLTEVVSPSFLISFSNRLSAIVGSAIKMLHDIFKTIICH